MKNINFLVLFVSALLLSNCGKDNNPNGTPPVSLLEMTQVLSTTEDKFIEYGQQPGTTPQEALGLAAEWLKTQPNISSALVKDNTVIDIKLKSGLPAIFFLNMVDQDSMSISRGGGSGGGILKGIQTAQSKHLIENKKVLLCYPNVKEFYSDNEVEKIINRFINSDLGLDVTVKKKEEVTPDLVSTFGSYGLVFINTHGIGDAFMTGSKITFDDTGYTDEDLKNWIIAHLSQTIYNNLEKGILRMGAEARVFTGPDWISKYKKYYFWKIWVGSEYINSLPLMSNTIVYGNFCFSGRTKVSDTYPNPIGTAFQSRNLISYYCYRDDNGNSSKVDNQFAKQMEDSLSTALVEDMDSTGNAHLSYTGSEFPDPHNQEYYNLKFTQYGADDYSYKNCVTVFTDNRDGIIYKAVCIGNQNWMAENLRYNAPGSVFYDDVSSNGLIYGKMYDWNTIMNGAGSSTENPSGVEGICPNGWHVPSPAEWELLIASVNHNIWDLKDKNYWNPPNTLATDKYGFSARGGGWWTPDDYELLNVFGEYWTSEKLVTGSVIAYRFQTGTNTLVPVAAGTGVDKKISCRCVKN